MYLRCCFCLLLFTAVGSITLLMWHLQIRLSTRRSVDSPLGLLNVDMGQNQNASRGLAD